ncbi:BatA domain-containing protein [Candidatus Woesearchaeota archaeon]|nr:BatA domain-containing protein [Candidatus Woesearchaeota archaeon]
MLGLENFFLDVGGLWALLALIPFILLYIIKPKPKKLIIPSLMFFIKDKDKANLNSFLQKFFNDFLFFLQLLIIILLAFTLAKPYWVVPSISYSDNLVIVMDASASMGAIEDGKTRFDRAKDIAYDRLDGKNTLILATDRSQLIIENANAGKTKDAIETLQPRETSSANFYDSIVLAENFATTDNSAVLVISDFANDRQEQEYFRAKLYLESKGIDVFFEDVSLNKAENVGIIDLEVSEDEVTAWVKNFKSTPETFNMKYGDKKQTISLEANDVTSFSVTTQLGKSTIELDINDDFKADNKAYISTPEIGSLNIVMITNEDEKYLETALELLGKVNLNIQRPPIVNIGNPDIVIIGKINKNVLIPGDMNKVKELCKEHGVPVIILGQENILGLGLGDMFPLELIKNEPSSTNYFVVSSQPDSYLTPGEMQFGAAKKIYPAKVSDNVLVFAETTQNDYPVITLSPYGRGKVLYYGIFDEYSDFKADIYYPIFWKRAIDTLIGGKTLGELNKQTGYLQTVSKEQVVKTPREDRTGQAITLDYAGFYEFSGFTVAANIIAEDEQNLNRGEISQEISELNLEAKKIADETKDRDLTYIFAVLIAALLIFELAYLKFRGDV